MNNEKELDFIALSVLKDLEQFIKVCKKAKEVGGYVLSSRGTKRFYVIVDKKTYKKYTEGKWKQK